MNLNSTIIKILITWIVNLSFIVAVAPQIYLNYKRKSTKGLSDFFLIAYLAGYTFNFFYTFAIDLPFPYKIRGVFAMLAAAFLVFQRFLYNWQQIKKIKKKFHIGNLLFLFLSGIFVFLFPIKGGHISGWVLTFVWIVYQLPQVIKIYERKSVRGLSFIFFTLVGLGNILELIAAVMLKLPKQNYFVGINGILVYFIFVYQFYKYGYFNKN